MRFLVFSLFFILGVLYSVDVSNAQVNKCNLEDIKPQVLSEINIDKEGLVKKREIISWENKGGSCLIEIKFGSDVSGDRKAKVNKIYDSDGKIIQPVIMNDIYLIQYDQVLESGKIYRLILEIELETKIKESDGSFYFSEHLQISKLQNPVVVIEIENMEPWYKIEFNQTTPFPDSRLDSNKLIWRLNDPKSTRTIENIEIEYFYIFNWNNLWLIIIGGIVGVVFDRLPRIFRKLKETKITFKLKN